MEYYKKAGGTCDYKCGTLNPCAPLASSYTPIQQIHPPKYGINEALTRGTLFPGLDLPFMNSVNKSHPYAGTPLGEIMALDFVQKELNLYLDTHPEDNEAFEMLQKVISLSKEARKKFVKRYGPLCITDLVDCEKYTWDRGPWPWEYTERGCID